MPISAPLVASQTVTGNGSSTATPVQLEFAWNLVAYAVVTAISGTSPVLAVFLQDSADGANFADVGNTGAITTTGTYRIAAGVGVGKWISARWTLTGTTPSATFKVDISYLPD